MCLYISYNPRVLGIYICKFTAMFYTAEPNEDYFLPDFNVEAISTLHNASNSLYFDVSIIQDGFLEYEECFVTALSLSDSVRGSLMVEIAGGKETAHVCIKNDDSKLLLLLHDVVW